LWRYSSSRGFFSFPRKRDRGSPFLSRTCLLFYPDTFLFFLGGGNVTPPLLLTNRQFPLPTRKSKVHFFFGPTSSFRRKQDTPPPLQRDFHFRCQKAFRGCPFTYCLKSRMHLLPASPLLFPGSFRPFAPSHLSLLVVKDQVAASPLPRTTIFFLRDYKEAW